MTEAHVMAVGDGGGSREVRARAVVFLGAENSAADVTEAGVRRVGGGCSKGGTGCLGLERRGRQEGGLGFRTEGRREGAKVFVVAVRRCLRWWFRRRLQRPDPPSTLPAHRVSLDLMDVREG
ncbi:hypothetical protein PLESTM_001200300 [Pleodorina starrii]|nr:hypothetical protein PLESTM_001200300 [Pleodorina starrii]